MAKMKSTNYAKVVAYTLGFLALVLGLASLASSNELKIVGDYTVVYPSVFKAALLSLKANIAYGIGALALAGFAAYALEAFLSDTGDWLGEMTTMKIIGFIGVPAVLAVACLLGPAYDIQAFTHVTIPTTEFVAEGLDSLFVTKNQADSLFNVAHGVK